MTPTQEEIYRLCEAITLIMMGDRDAVDFEEIVAIAKRHGITIDEEGYVESVTIECSACYMENDVEGGTWALEKGMCETCYCEYQGG